MRAYPTREPRTFSSQLEAAAYRGYMLATREAEFRKSRKTWNKSLDEIIREAVAYATTVELEAPDEMGADSGCGEMEVDGADEQQPECRSLGLSALGYVGSAEPSFDRVVSELECGEGESA